MAAAQLVGGYHAIALPLEHSAFRRYIYAKKHHVKESESSESLLAAERTAYFVNLPAAADEAWLRACLEPAVGSIQHVVTGGIKSNNSSISGSSSGSASDPLVAKTAHVVFKSKDALKKVLKVKQLDVPTDESDDAVGLQAYLRQYRANKPGLAAVKAIADAYMSKFDADEEEDFRQREELKAQVDDDGFKTVVNTKKRSGAAAEDLARPAKKQKAKEMDNFYRFQMRERKRDQLKSLRERFEEDRLQVEKLKKANRFKPE